MQPAKAKINSMKPTTRYFPISASFAMVCNLCLLNKHGDYNDQMLTLSGIKYVDWLVVALKEFIRWFGHMFANLRRSPWSARRFVTGTTSYWVWHVKVKQSHLYLSEWHVCWFDVKWRDLNHSFIVKHDCKPVSNFHEITFHQLDVWGIFLCLFSANKPLEY